MHFRFKTLNIASNDGSNTCDWFYQAWIGLSYNGDHFGWSDNTPFDYSSWVKDAPYDVDERKCVLTWVGQTCFGDGWDNGAAEWDNRECGTRALNYVCKKYRSY
uniref:C-type lectin domain-containing protein n=1 Tax=Panagrolaimus davidi TaxID=227884 RepID=A0A914P4M2_9BILA